MSMQIGMPKTINYNDQMITTGIFKYPILGPVMLRTLGLDGDGQADLKVHGGIDKALYAYGFDAYAWWKTNRPQDPYTHGAFGENLTLESLDEDRILIDDVFELGEAIIQVTQPRFPCYKLAAKFRDTHILKEFMKSRRPGVYFRVLREGKIDVGNELKLVKTDASQRTVADVFVNRNSR